MDVWEVCAAGRGAESLAQPGGTRRDVPGPSGLPEGESRREQQHAREAGDRPKTPEASPRKARLIRRKLDCLNPNQGREPAPRQPPTLPRSRLAPVLTEAPSWMS